MNLSGPLLHSETIVLGAHHYHQGPSALLKAVPEEQIETCHGSLALTQDCLFFVWVAVAPTSSAGIWLLRLALYAMLCSRLGLQIHRVMKM